MTLKTTELDDDVYEMAIRIAGRIGKGLSDTLQDGLIAICRQHGWSVQLDEEEQLDEGEREEIYVLWTKLEPKARAHILGLLEDPDTHRTTQELADALKRARAQFEHQRERADGAERLLAHAHREAARKVEKKLRGAELGALGGCDLRLTSATPPDQNPDSGFATETGVTPPDGPDWQPVDFVAMGGIVVVWARPKREDKD